MVSISNLRIPVPSRIKSRRTASLSTYFPKGTQYFYGYPAGEDSGFLNKVPPAVEELVAERAISCAGSHVSVISFAATAPPFLSQNLLKKFDLPRLKKKRLLVLPEAVNENLRGVERNNAIKESLLDIVNPHNFVMAQPYASQSMADAYQISADLTTWLNDKNNMTDLIHEQFLPKRIAVYENGTAFAAGYQKLPLPYVAKASSSSAGDGVFICLTEADVTRALEQLQAVKGTVLIEQYIAAVNNYGVHFGIPHDASKPIDFLGINEQLTTPAGQFIGGIIGAVDFPRALIQLKRYLLKDVLPKVRQRGWYGVGCFDVLIDANGQAYFIDSNFRMTGMTAYHFLSANRTIRTPLLAFSGEFTGSQRELENSLLPYASHQSKEKMVQLIALGRHGDTWSFNAALFFETEHDLFTRISTLLHLGIASSALQQVAEHTRRKVIKGLLPLADPQSFSVLPPTVPQTQTEN